MFRLFFFFFFYPNSRTAPKAQDGYINKFISQKKTYLYIQILCLWSALCMSNTIMMVLWIILFFFLGLLSFFTLCTQLQTCQLSVNVMKMWKRAPHHVGQSECRFTRIFTTVTRHIWCLSFFLMQMTYFCIWSQKWTLYVLRDQIVSLCALNADQPVWR